MKKHKITIIILSVLLLVSVALNGFLISNIYKFKKTLSAYRIYAEELHNKLDDIQQKADKIELGVKHIIEKSTKHKQ